MDFDGIESSTFMDLDSVDKSYRCALIDKNSSVDEVRNALILNGVSKEAADILQGN